MLMKKYLNTDLLSSAFIQRKMNVVRELSWLIQFKIIGY